MSAEFVASLAMYPFQALRQPTDALWHSVRRHLGWGPDELEWIVLTPDVWHHPQLLLAQTCGWPLVTELAEFVAVVGTFDYDVPGSQGGYYRSVIVTRHDATLAELRARPGSIAAVNAYDSLSGWVSLQHVWGGQPDAIVTGAHLESVRAVAEGRTDLASIDGVSWSQIQMLEPALVTSLRVIGEGPLVPCLPVVAHWSHAGHVAALRAAFAAAVAEPGLAESLATLRIRGFVPMELADYSPLTALLG